MAGETATKQSAAVTRRQKLLLWRGERGRGEGNVEAEEEQEKDGREKS